MKKEFILTIISIVMGLNVSSQTVITNDYSSSNSTYQHQNVKTDENYQEQPKETTYSYHAIEDGWGICMDAIISHFVIGGGYYSGKTGNGVVNNSGFELYIGGNYRAFLSNNLYIDARVLGGYYQWTYDINKNKNTTNEGFIGLSPIAGLKFGKLSIFAGYRWDWVKFKFKKEYCVDRFIAGISIDV